MKEHFDYHFAAIKDCLSIEQLSKASTMAARDAKSGNLNRDEYRKLRDRILLRAEEFKNPGKFIDTMTIEDTILCILDLVKKNQYGNCNKYSFRFLTNLDGSDPNFFYSCSLQGDGSLFSETLYLESGFGKTLLNAAQDLFAKVYNDINCSPANSNEWKNKLRTYNVE